MKIVNGYMLSNINGTSYVLPVGQNIALLKKGVQLNETGSILWNALKSGIGEKHLLPSLIEYYGANESDVPMLQEDIYSFLKQLDDFHLIERESDPPTCHLCLNINNLIIGYHGQKHLLHPSLLDFECNTNPIDQNWIIVPQAPDPYPLGEIVIRTEEIEILRNSEAYIITLLSTSPRVQIKLSPDGVNARFYCSPPYGTAHIEALFHAFRHAFLLYAQKKGIFALHSSSILYQNKVWLFSAPSGTGKSTQADLWQKLYQVRILNGDLNLIHFQDSIPMVSGLPWCGTSHIYSNDAFPLGGIVLLKKNENNFVLELTKTEQVLSVTQRLITPAWTEEMLSSNLEFSLDLVTRIPVFQLQCSKDSVAAHILKQYIHQFL
ncbi:MAG: hypothetical protein K0R46_1889 [Herbinix sp.]|jgi:hypothetical protein|nr:hypothetical protein [Herbinix sp.]